MGGRVLLFQAFPGWWVQGKRGLQVGQLHLIGKFEEEVGMYLWVKLVLLDPGWLR